MNLWLLSNAGIWRVNALTLMLPLLALIAPGISAGADDTAQVVTTQGTFIGREGPAGLEFKGIPFAQPPVGAGRWAPPVPLEPAPRRHLAAEYGPACLQTLAGTSNLETSEDCLNLNIWTPAADTARRPVLVWIHGGGLRAGSNRVNGAVFAERGIVLVSINYRLGPLGFFAHDALAGETANPAVLDMILALRWIKQNIEAFGGDPDRVTISGVSAGAMAVNLLMTTTASEGLFHGAMAFSGYGTWALPRSRAVAANPPFAMDLSPAVVAEEQGRELVARVDAAATTAEQLRQLDGQELVDAFVGFQLPIVDGTTLSAEPGQIFRAGEAHPLPYVTGGNSYEGSVMPASKISVEHYARILGEFRSDVEALYPQDFARGLSAGLMRVFGDHRYLLSARVLGSASAGVQQPTWLYYVDFVPESQSGKWPGTPHGVDAYLLFGGHESEESATKALVERMRSYWSNFARDGDPNGAGLTPWPRYHSQSDRWLVFGAQDQIREGVLRPKLDLLEAHYLQRIGEVSSKGASIKEASSKKETQ